jgi:hypothetical protein
MSGSSRFSPDQRAAGQNSLLLAPIWTWFQVINATPRSGIELDLVRRWANGSDH